MKENKQIIILIGLILFLVVAVGGMAFYKSSGKYNMNVISGTEYYPGDAGQVIVDLRDVAFNPIVATCRASIYYPNKTIMVNASLMSSTGAGSYYYNFTVPEVFGVYEYISACNRSGRNFTAGKSFHVGLLGKKVDTLSLMSVLLEDSVDNAVNGQEVSARWRLDTAQGVKSRIIAFSCNKYTSMSFSDKYADLQWLVNGTVGTVDYARCNITVLLNDSLTVDLPPTPVYVNCTQNLATSSGCYNPGVGNYYEYIDGGSRGSCPGFVPLGIPTAFYMNYSASEFITTNTSIRVVWGLNDSNYTVPACTNYAKTVSKYVLKFETQNNFNPTYFRAYCYNGTGWYKFEDYTDGSAPFEKLVSTSSVAIRYADGNISTGQGYDLSNRCLTTEVCQSGGPCRTDLKEVFMNWELAIPYPIKIYEVTNFVNVFSRLKAWVQK